MKIKIGVKRVPVKTTGAYGIFNVVSGKVYVGSSGRCLVRRWKQHKGNLS